MSLSHVTSKSAHSAGLSTLPGKDTNLATTNDELTSTIASLTATVANLNKQLMAALATESQWGQRVRKVEDLLKENGVEQFLSTSRKEELEDLLSRAKNYASASIANWEEIKAEIKTCESHLEEAQEAKNKIALLLVTKNLDFFPQHGLGAVEPKTDSGATREIRSVIATAQALISLREGK